MACVNPDGSLTESAKALLKSISTPLGPEEISKKLGQPLFKIRSSLREMVSAGLVNEEKGKYIVTKMGKEKI
jgi:predicted transcriptional regulator